VEEDALVKRGAYNGEQDVDEEDGGGYAGGEYRCYIAE